VIRQWLLATALVSFVLSGVSMSAHSASGAEPVDLVVASVGADSVMMDVSVYHAGTAAAGMTPAIAESSSVTCLGCTDESLPVHDPGMVMAIGCVFVALAVGALALFLLRLDGSARSPLGPRVALRRPVRKRAFTLAHPPPDLLALGISRT
jgi:hypothetical protein